MKKDDKKTTRSRTRSSAAPSRVMPTSRLISADEKRQLILAHSQSRQPLDRQAQISMWIGLTVSIVFIVVGWMYTMGGTIRKSFAGAPDPAVQTAIEGGKMLGESFDEARNKIGQIGGGIQDVADKLNAMDQREDTLNRIANEIQSTSTEVERKDLFQPATQ
jgi:hypothetical protein